MNINSPLLRKFITLGRVDADIVKTKQQEFASTAELIAKCGKIDSKDLAAQCIDLFRVPFFDLKDFNTALISPELIKEKLIRKHHILPLVQKGRKVYIAASDPTDYGAFENFEFSTGLSCEVVVVDYIQLDKKIEQLLDATGSLNLSDDEFKEFAELDADIKKDTPKDDDKDDAPIIVYINKILMDAIKKGASDLHFEPYEHKYRIRFRIDGILHEVASPPNSLATKLSARIKVMSRLDIAEKRKTTRWPHKAKNNRA